MCVCVMGNARAARQGSLEVCFLGLEEFDASADTETLHGLTLPICDGVTQFYRERFPNLNATTGATIFVSGRFLFLDVFCFWTFSVSGCFLFLDVFCFWLM